MAIRINYDLSGHGWANIQISSGPQKVDMSASFLHDTLAELIGAANLLLKGAPEVKVMIMQEPGAYLVYLQAMNKGHMAIGIRHFKGKADWGSVSSNEHVVFNGQDMILNVSTQILQNASRLLSTYGMDGYKARWVNYEFPIMAYNRLKALLNK
jgi:hypothetical protein